MNVIRLVPKDEFELPITCLCGTQVALAWHDFYISERLEPTYIPMRGFINREFKDLIFPPCPGCGRSLGPTEDHRSIIDRWNYALGRQKKAVRVVVDELLQKERDAANIDVHGYLKPPNWREEAAAAEEAKRLAEQARQKLTPKEREALKL